MLHYGDKCVAKSCDHPDLLFQILKFKRWFVFGHLLNIMCEPIVISFIFSMQKYTACCDYVQYFFGLVNPNSSKLCQSIGDIKGNSVQIHSHWVPNVKSRIRSGL